MATIELNQENFQEVIEKNDFVIIDFWAPWCGPCQSFGPIYEEISAKYPEIVFAKVDTQSEQELGGTFNIRSIPTLMIFREQVIIYSEAGALPAAAFEKLIAQAQGLDMDEVRKQIAEEQAATTQA